MFSIGTAIARISHSLLYIDVVNRLISMAEGVSSVCVFSIKLSCIYSNESCRLQGYCSGNSVDRQQCIQNTYTSLLSAGRRKLRNRRSCLLGQVGISNSYVPSENSRISSLDYHHLIATGS